MRRKIIIINGFIFFCSSIFLLIFHTITIKVSNSDLSQKNLEEYSILVDDYFNGYNIEETLDYFSSIVEFEITILDSNKNVITGTTNYYHDSVEYDVVYNESNNTHLYLIKNSSNSNYILELSIDKSGIDSNVVLFGLISGIVLSLILIGSVSTSLYLIKRTFKPINNVIDRLQTICDNDQLTIDDEHEIHIQLDGIQQQIQNKINDLEKENLKIEGILEASAEGIIVINNDKKIILINNKAIDIFDLNNDVLNASFYELNNSKELILNVENYFVNKSPTKKETFINNKVYSLKTVEIDNEYIKGLLIILDDITAEYNLSKVKKDFFQNASHELKSPLTSIIGYQQLIQNGIYSTQDDILDGVNSTLKQANRMNSMIVDMLELSNLEADYKPVVVEVDVVEVVTKVLDDLKIFIEKRKINIVLDVTKCVKITNRNHIEQVIKNIIENGIKYNKEEGDLKISLNENNFIVKDNGVGIARENFDRIFERFYRVSSNNKIRGNGLGLAIVKHIVNMYNYDITIDSVLGEYTEVKITF